MLSRRVEHLSPYVPAEQPSDRPYVKLNANENPYPPASAVAEAVRDAVGSNTAKLGLYPDPDATALREAIAAMLNATGGVLANAEAARARLSKPITPAMIFCGNGSDEVLSLVFCAFFDSTEPLVLPQFTYSFYPVYCGFYGVSPHRVPLTADWRVDARAMVEAACQSHSPLILANPNAPTGDALTTAEVEAMLAHFPRDRAFVVDEAYADFGEESCLPLLERFENLVVVRTFSKSLSFAGLRLGYAVANEEATSALFTVKNSFNHFPVDYLAQVAGKAACESYEYYAATAKRIAHTRDEFAASLRDKGWRVISAKANFVFAQRSGVAGDVVYQRAKAAGYLIRHFADRGIEDFVRITVGTETQMSGLLSVLSGI